MCARGEPRRRMAAHSPATLIESCTHMSAGCMRAHARVPPRLPPTRTCMAEQASTTASRAALAALPPSSARSSGADHSKLARLELGLLQDGERAALGMQTGGGRGLWAGRPGLAVQQGVAQHRGQGRRQNEPTPAGRRISPQPAAPPTDLARAGVAFADHKPGGQPRVRLGRQRQRAAAGGHRRGAARRPPQRQQGSNDHAGRGAPPPHLAVEHQGGARGRVPAALQQQQRSRGGDVSVWWGGPQGASQAHRGRCASSCQRSPVPAPRRQQRSSSAPLTSMRSWKSEGLGAFSSVTGTRR